MYKYAKTIIILYNKTLAKKMIKLYNAQELNIRVRLAGDAF